jgi:hypothetical protein
MNIVKTHAIEREICDALGLKNVRFLTLRFSHDHVPMAEVEFFLEIDGVKQLPPILKKFELVEIPEKRGPEEPNA